MTLWLLLISGCAIIYIYIATCGLAQGRKADVASIQSKGVVQTNKETLQRTYGEYLQIDACGLNTDKTRFPKANCSLGALF
jgi:hypothetical protein